MRIVVVLTLAVSTVWVPGIASSALAQEQAATRSDAICEPPPGDDPIARARQLFQCAEQRDREGNPVGAMELYRQSLALAARPSTAVNLARLLFRAGRMREADALLSQVLDASFGAPPAEVRRVAIAYAAEVRAALATVRINLEGPEGTTLRLDGELVQDAAAGSSVELRVDPGTHRFLARGPRGEQVELAMDLSAGQRREETIQVEAIAVVSPEGGPITPGPEWYEEPAIHIVLGLALAAGIASLIGGVVYWNDLPSDPVWGRADALRF